MLDVTQLNSSLSKTVAHVGGKPGLSWVLFAPARLPATLPVVNRPPMVTWRVTRACNLGCSDCPPASPLSSDTAELTTVEGLELINDLAAYGVFRLIFAGGEPLLRDDLAELVAYTHHRGIQPTLLTSGTLLSRRRAAELQRAGLHGASILLEDLRREADRQFGMGEAFTSVLEAYDHCEAAGLPAEIRIPLNRRNYFELGDILNLMERRRIRRVVFAHMVYDRCGNSPHYDLNHLQKRRALNLIFDHVEDFHRRGVDVEIATDENHVDGIYRYLQIARRSPYHAAALFELLSALAANVQGAGVGCAGIDPEGGVHPDAYWGSHVLGNVRETPFREIWDESRDPLLRGLRDRLPRLKGRCANCRGKRACGGNLRVRADQVFGDPWMPDPACYLTEEEIGKKVTARAKTMADDVLLADQAA